MITHKTEPYSCEGFDGYRVKVTDGVNTVYFGTTHSEGLPFNEGLRLATQTLEKKNNINTLISENP